MASPPRPGPGAGRAREQTLATGTAKPTEAPWRLSLTLSIWHCGTLRSCWFHPTTLLPHTSLLEVSPARARGLVAIPRQREFWPVNRHHSWTPPSWSCESSGRVLQGGGASIEWGMKWFDRQLTLCKRAEEEHGAREEGQRGKDRRGVGRQMEPGHQGRTYEAGLLVCSNVDAERRRRQRRSW